MTTTPLNPDKMSAAEIDDWARTLTGDPLEFFEMFYEKLIRGSRLSEHEILIKTMKYTLARMKKC